MLTIAGVARITFATGMIVIVVGLVLIFVPLHGPARCLDDVGQGSELPAPCPPFDHGAADPANLVGGTLVYGSPVLAGAGVLILLIGWMPEDAVDADRIAWR